MADRIYTMCEQVNIAGALTVLYNFSISANNRQLKIRSITLDHYLINNTTGKPVPLEQNTEVQLTMRIGSTVTGQNFSNQFIQAGGMPFVYNGNCIFITRPCNLQFNSFVVTNNLPFLLTITNTSAVTQYMNYVSLLVEVEEKIIWNAPPVETFRIEE